MQMYRERERRGTEERLGRWRGIGKENRGEITEEGWVLGSGDGGRVEEKRDG